MELPIPPKLDLMDLPTEMHIYIAEFLPYPDALALKHTCRHFYRLVCTDVHLKVDWLVQRFELKLECPLEQCSFRTDESFCNWRIRRIMERRRWHLECPRVRGGCLVVTGSTCQADLVPTWLKRRSRAKILKTLAFWGNEALIIGMFALALHLLWALLVRYVSRHIRPQIHPIPEDL
ncbi:hypothetical protein ASPZODRAFT_128616 [Penicilliopsis zonata CBS 506.65]|uniref:F-box domain-containing protein n=1 Tax=Penicilliopsis zonata CBS 506.65 TaxID=1073090 RepID=A0A1L9SS53_9EURO|nr:hypothetical protein ASPZODRAFT_128616 [Penicilliopsis zonata CBS 506.65]OJJ50028.1 hypothetical protein ASPZODRAFT_128616 [Penicilliopsis zonata CBS 506.65]